MSRGLHKQTAQLSQLQKSNGGNIECLQLPVINIKWSDVTAVAFLILMVIGLLATGMAIFFFMKNKSTPLVSASNRELIKPSFVCRNSLVFCSYLAPSCSAYKDVILYCLSLKVPF